MQQGTFQKEIYWEILNEIPSVLFLLLSKEGVIIQANRFAKQFVGKPLVGMAFNDILVDFTAGFDVTELPFIDGTPQDRERPPNEWGADHLLTVETSSGLPQSYLFSFRPMWDQCLAMGHADIDVMNMMQREILRLNQDLGNLNRELHKKNRRLDLLNREKNQFLGMAGHDLRRPIGVILNYNEILTDEATPLLTEEHQLILSRIQSNCVSMKRIVDDFLKISAIESGTLPLDIQNVSPVEILQQSLIHCKTLANRKQISLHTTTGNDLPLVKMDPSKFEQVIVNLVENAIDHSSPKSEIQITLDCDETNMIFTVEDCGCGIASTQLDNLFEPDKAPCDGNLERRKGGGLGLIIVKKIVDAHNGTIDIESRVGKGTRALVQLPIEPARPM